MTSGTNPVATYTPLNNATQNASVYKATIDGNDAVAKRVIDQFAAHQVASPNMTVMVDAGSIMNGITLTEVAQQTSGTITAPSAGMKRIDRIVITTAGVIGIITGTPTSGTPSPPAITSGNLPVAQVSLLNSTTAITNSIITDERNFWGLGDGVVQSRNIATGAVGSSQMAAIGSGGVLSNITGGSAAPVSNNPTSILDAVFGSTQGQVLYRGSSIWAALNPGSSGQVLTCAGPAANPFWNTASGVFNQQSFTSSGTWTKPGGYDPTAMVLCQIWAAGGGGAGGNQGGGGGGGSFREFWLPLSACGSTESVTVGTGGAGGSNTAFGSPGGSSSFGSHVTAYGGSGGPGCGGGYNSTAAHSAFNDCYEGWAGSLNSSSANCPWQFSGSITWSIIIGGSGVFTGGGSGNTGAGGSSIWGGGGGGQQNSGAGGSSQFGGNGGAAGGNNANGIAGTAPSGGGGSGGANVTTGGAGARGQVIITVFA